MWFYSGRVRFFSTRINTSINMLLYNMKWKGTLLYITEQYMPEMCSQPLIHIITHPRKHRLFFRLDRLYLGKAFLVLSQQHGGPTPWADHARHLPQTGRVQVPVLLPGSHSLEIHINLSFNSHTSTSTLDDTLTHGRGGLLWKPLGWELPSGSIYQPLLFMRIPHLFPKGMSDRMMSTELVLTGKRHTSHWTTSMGSPGALWENNISL